MLSCLPWHIVLPSEESDPGNHCPLMKVSKSNGTWPLLPGLTKTLRQFESTQTANKKQEEKKNLILYYYLYF